MRQTLEVFLAGDDRGTLLRNLIGRARGLNLEVDLLVIVLGFIYLFETFLADGCRMCLLGFLGRQVRDLLTGGFGSCCLSHSGLLLLVGFSLLNKPHGLSSERLLGIVDLLLHFLRDLFTRSLLGDGLLGGGKGGGSLRNLLVR